MILKTRCKFLYFLKFLDILKHCSNYFKFPNTGILRYEPHHEKTGFLHMRKQRRRSAAQ